MAKKRARRPAKGGTGQTTAVLYVGGDSTHSETVATELEAVADRLTVETVTSAAAALDQLREVSVDCVVSEYELPGMDGLAFLETVRERDSTLPFIVYTDSGSEAVAAEAISLDVSGYVRRDEGTDTTLAAQIEEEVQKHRERHSSQLTTQALAGARDGLAVFDEDGQFEYVNEAYASVYGYTPEELVDGGWEKLYPEQEIARYKSEIRPRLHTEGGWIGECTCLHADGFRFRSTHSISQLDGGGHICVLHHGSIRSADQSP